MQYPDKKEVNAAIDALVAAVSSEATAFTKLMADSQKYELDELYVEVEQFRALVVKTEEARREVFDICSGLLEELGIT